MKTSSIFLFSIFITGFLNAQTGDSQLPEKEIALARAKLDSLSWYISSGLMSYSNDHCNLQDHREYILKSDPGCSFSEMSRKLSGNKKEDYIRVHALNDLAMAQFYKKDYTGSTRYWEKALSITVQDGFSFEELHKFRPALNNNFFLAGDYTNAMKMSSDGLARSSKINDSNRIAHFSNVLGYIHMKQKNFVQAGQYFSVQLQLNKAMKDPLGEAHALYNLADLSIAEQQYDKAISFLDQSIAVYRASVSLNSFHLSEREGYISNKMAEAYKLKGNYREALPFALIAVHTAIADDEFTNDYDDASYFINAADIYNRLQLPDSAIFLLHSGINIARRIIHREYIRDACEQLSIAFAQKKIFDSAYQYQSLFERLKDSISNESNQQEILQREASLKIQQQSVLQQAALERQKLWRNIVIGIAIFSFITLGFLYNRYRLRQKNRYQQQLNQQQNELFNTIAVTQDQERKRIAEDIHDSLGSILSAAKLKLSALKESQPDLDTAQSEKYQVTMQLLDEASAELRNVSHNIMPATLSKLGLVAALRNLIDNISSHEGLQMDFSAHDLTARLDEKTEMSIYRIVLELINNIVKHAAASKVTLQLIRYPDHINLSAEDNGKGFDYENELQVKKGIGLGNILSRVNYLKGTMHVDAQPGRGTMVIIDIPYVS